MLVLDLETELMRPGYMAPRPVVIQLASPEPIGLPLDEYALEQPSVLVPGWTEVVATAASRAYAPAARLAMDGLRPILGQNLAFELSCLVEHGDGDFLARALQAWELLDGGLVIDVGIRQKLLDIALGLHSPHVNYNLQAIAERYGYQVDKTNPWRLRFAELEHVPLARWPAEALGYAIGDVAVPAAIWQDQERAAANLSAELGGPVLHDQHRRASAAFALHLVGAHGLHTDPAAVELYRSEVTGRANRARDTLLAERLIYLGRDGEYHTRQKKMRERIVALWESRGHIGPASLENPSGWPATASGKYPTLDESVAKALGDPVMRAWSDWGQASSALDSVADVEQGAGAVPLHTSFDLASSGRSRSFKPNVQNRPVKGRDRECFAPRTERAPVSAPRAAQAFARALGRVVPMCYLDTDHDGLELGTVAQVLIWTVGYSRLAEALCEGRDPHLELGAKLLGITYAEALSRYKAGDKEVFEARQTGKIGNFGFAGGCGVATFIAQSLAKYGVVISVELATRLKEAWLETWPEFREYFRIIGRLTRSGHATLRQYVSGRYRGGLIFTESCNTMFQGLGADLTMDVLFELQRACYATPSSPLYGCRVENYVHDQYLLAVPRDEYLDERAAAKREIVCGVAQRWLPDLRPTATPIACARWSKNAREVRDEHGRLHVWEYDPLVDAIWKVGGAFGDQRAKVAGKLGEIGAQAAGMVDVLERGAADIALARRALDARLCDETTGYERGPGVERALVLAHDVVGILAPNSSLCA